MYNAKYLQPQVSTKGLFAHYKLWDGLMTGDRAELVTNGDFESGFTDGTGDGWNFVRGNPSEETVDIHGGAHAQEVTNPAGNTGVITQTKPTVSGRKYRLSFWAKKSKGSGGRFTDVGSSSYILEITINQVVYTEYVRYFVSTGDDIKLAFYANTDAVNDIKGILFDDVSLKLLDEIFDYTSSGKGGTLIDTDTPKTLVPTYPGFNFDGDNDYISIDDHADFTPDSNELVANGDFSAWTVDNPTSWGITGESAPDPEISEVGNLEGHGGTGTGYCNLYTSDGTNIGITKTITYVIGRKYRFSINVNKVTSGAIKVEDTNTQWPITTYTTPGIQTFTFVATVTSSGLRIFRQGGGVIDVTFDDVSVTPVKPLHISISAWIYMHDASDFCIASKGIEATDGEWRFYTDGSDKLLIHCYDESINKYIGRKFNTALTQNVWTHLVATYDGGTSSTGLKLYRNGIQIDDTDDNAATFIAVENLTHDVWIGRYDTNYADGLIDDMMFFNRVLGDTEVKSIYSVTRQRYGV